MRTPERSKLLLPGAGIAAPLHVDWLVQGATPLLDVPGRVGLSSCPGRPQGDQQLLADLERLQDLRISTVLSLVDEHEMRVYGVTGLSEALCAHGIRHLRYPMIDDCPPFSLEDTRTLCQTLRALLGQGEHILIHCIGGWGRSGTIAACLLTHEGHDADTAIALVRQSRSPLCVASLAQEEFIAAYARHLGKVGANKR